MCIDKNIEVLFWVFLAANVVVGFLLVVSIVSFCKDTINFKKQIKEYEEWSNTNKNKTEW